MSSRREQPSSETPDTQPDASPGDGGEPAGNGGEPRPLPPDARPEPVDMFKGERPGAGTPEDSDTGGNGADE